MPNGVGMTRRLAGGYFDQGYSNLAPVQPQSSRINPSLQLIRLGAVIIKLAAILNTNTTVNELKSIMTRMYVDTYEDVYTYFRQDM